MMTHDERSQTAQREFLEAVMPAWQTLQAVFEHLLKADLECTLRAGANQYGVKDRPLWDAWNGIGTMLIKKGMFGWAEHVYTKSLTAEREVDAQHKVSLRKGYSYHNLGYAQFLQGNLAQGIQNIRRAVQEDRRVGTDLKDSLAERTTREIAAREWDVLKKDILTPALGGSGCTLSTDVIGRLFDAMTPEMRLQAASSIRTARTAADDTDFGRTLRLNALRDACYFLEAWFRERGHPGGGLKGCLDSAYGRKGGLWWPRVAALWNCRLTRAKDTAEAAAHLGQIRSAAPAGTADDLLVRSHLLAGLMRNWTHHWFDPDAPLLNDPEYHELYCSPWVCLYHAQAEGV